jgi:hypothetical protein
MEEEDRDPAGAEEDRKPAAKKRKKIAKTSASGQKEEDPTDWRRKCIEKFHLQELPESCEDSKLISLSKSDDSTWKRYYEFRSLLQKEGKESDDDEDPEGDIGLLREFRNLMKGVADEISCPWWKKHVMQTILDSSWDDDDLRTVEVQATIFSPVAIPHALRFQHRHHNRSRLSSVEFYCYWHFQLLRFDGKPIQSKSDAQVSIGDYITLDHAKTFFKDLDHYGLKGSQSYLADDQMEVLCNNGLLECPNVQGPNGDNIWTAVEDIDVHNFTPTTVNRMRRWLRIADPSVFGRKAGRRKPPLLLLNDFEFLRLLFASVGGEDDFVTTKTGGSSPGYTWRPDSDFFRHYDLTEHVSTNWLDYQARLVSGALRPFDIYYQPYDPWKDKAEWGRRLLDEWDCGETEEELKKLGLLEEDETMEDIANAPKWVLWERAEKSADQGLPKAMLAQMMGMLKMTNR